MPGGIGPVDSDCAKALCLTQREVSLPASADELRIFYNLSMHRVHYFPCRHAIYYVESRHVPVQETIFATLGHSAPDVVITQLYLDRLGYFKIGKRATLSPAQAATVLVALRLQGVRVSVS
ncbi:MAG: hypothetical protein H6964_08115 [Chromatiaceae bacterium]|nr:hypothetical protein [Gammaproteobacteria bacterium]MCP5427149.1 hypothetical protein [Chromatiaceae bacterium]MCP5446944.1 hypothetical protein [Chromatiaceae bacterium]